MLHPCVGNENPPGGNLLGKKTYQTFLVINGVVGPVLLGGAVATFFTGSDFYFNKANMTDTIMPVISHWGNGWHGLDALTNIWNVILGLAVFFLARVLGALYFINNIDTSVRMTNDKKNTRNKTVLLRTARRHLSVSSLSSILLMK